VGKAIHETLGSVAEYCKEHSQSVEAISVTSQRASIIPLDNQGEPLYRSIMWQDKRSIEESEFLERELTAAKVYEKTGLRIDSYFSAPKILWLKKQEPEIFARAHSFVGVQDYVIYLLTGTIVTDASQATRTLMMNLEERAWDDELLSTIGIDESRLPRIVDPGSIGGYLEKGIAEAVGLQAGIPIILAGGDQACAAMALGMVEPGMVVANTGTGSFTLGYSRKPRLHKERKTLCSAGTIPGSYFIEGGLITGGVLVQWFVEQFYQGYTADLGYDLLFAEANKSPVGSNGVVLLPHFKGAAAPFWNPKAKGMFFNLTLATTRGDMARAVLEGISLDMALNFTAIKELVGADFKSISIGGGMTRRDLFNQMQADVYQLPVTVAESPEASTQGAWMSGVVALGHHADHQSAYKAIASKRTKRFDADAESSKVYETLQENRLLLYDVLTSRPELYERFL
jgi:glycerol kinase